MNSSPLVNRLLALPRPIKRLIALGIDAALCVISVHVAFFLRLGEWADLWGAPTHPTLASIAIALPIFVSFGLYRAVFRYAGGEALLSIVRAVGVYSVPFICIYTLVGVYAIPRTVGLIQPLILLLLVAASRMLARVYLGPTYQALWRDATSRVLIYGAGTAGRHLASVIRNSSEMLLAGFVDDDANLWNSTVNGIHVYDPAGLEKVIAKKSVTDILLALPSTSKARKAEILRDLRKHKVRVRTLPSLIHIAQGEVSVSDLRDVEIEDLLGRSPVAPNEALLREEIAGKVVMVTGAGGSIGSELSRQIAKCDPARLLLLDNSEYNLYAIHHELTRPGAEALHGNAVVPLLGSVCDRARMTAILAQWNPEVIFHAAAYKHVPLVEQNVLEGLRNNVFGTLTVADLAARTGCAKLVLVSTDKAVRPTSVMGASKRVAEMILQAFQEQRLGTCFSMVRFGNVLDSSGSVVPLFRRQIAAGGPVTITHPKVTRYFMTIPEAAQLVLQAGSLATGGEVFLLDMGEPVKIIDLARTMVELSGLAVRDESNPGGDIEIQVVGLRPGEKLFEELLIGSDSEPTLHPRIRKARESFLDANSLSERLDELQYALVSGDEAAAKRTLKLLVPEFREKSALCDAGIAPDEPANWGSDGIAVTQAAGMRLSGSGI